MIFSTTIIKSTCETHYIPYTYSAYVSYFIFFIYIYSQLFCIFVLYINRFFKHCFKISFYLLIISHKAIITFFKCIIVLVELFREKYGHFISFVLQSVESSFFYICFNHCLGPSHSPSFFMPFSDNLSCSEFGHGGAYPIRSFIHHCT